MTQRRAELPDRVWQPFKLSLKALGNVFCQRVDANGRRCTRPVYFFHHIIALEQRRDLGVHHENVVGVCASCHPRPSDSDQGR
jgi:hypothetical protein